MKKAICIALTVMLVMSLCMIPSMAADENVALGKPVSAQTDTPDTVVPALEDNNFWGAAFLTDGIIKDFDTTQDGGPIGLYGAVSTAVGPAMSADIIVDLQGKFDINTIKLYPMGFLQGQNLPEEFSVAASDDGNNWTTVAEETGVTARKFDNPFVYEKKLTAKFVKIHVAKAASQVADDAWFYYGFSELEVFGTKASDAPAGDAAPAYDSSLVYNCTTGNNIGVWLQTTDTESLATVFNVDKPFNEIKFDIFWASNPPTNNGSKNYNFKLDIYKFSYNYENSVAGTPVASGALLDIAGDNYNTVPSFSVEGTNLVMRGANNGLQAVLLSDLPAGQYVMVITNDAGEGSYLVLPTGEGDLADCKFYRGTAEGQPIRFALNTAGQFVDLIPDSEVPAPQTGDMAIAMFAVIAVVALAAVVVFKKRVNG